jgi:hypothetical protein
MGIIETPIESARVKNTTSAIGINLGPFQMNCNRRKTIAQGNYEKSSINLLAILSQKYNDSNSKKATD